MDVFEKWNIKIVDMEKQDIRFAAPELPVLGTSYEDERKILDMVAAGRVEAVEELLLQTDRQLKAIRIGKMSSSAFRQVQYSAVIVIALATRRAIEGGVDAYEAYTLSDSLIQKVDRLCDADTILRTALEALLLFAQRVAQDKTAQQHRGVIRLCIHTIKEHCPLWPGLPMLAAACGLSPGYLSHLFTHQTGQSLRAFYNTCRIQLAQKLLEEGKLSHLEISIHLNYSSQSHFIRSFRAACGQTPAAYLRRHSPV